jgi:hypothetical protein
LRFNPKTFRRWNSSNALIHNTKTVFESADIEEETQVQLPNASAFQIEADVRVPDGDAEEEAARVALMEVKLGRVIEWLLTVETEPEASFDALMDNDLERDTEVVSARRGRHQN